MMKKYELLEKSAKFIEGYTETDGLNFILTSCRIKPFDYLFRKARKLKIYKSWIDEFGNILELINKDLEITYGSLEYDRDKLICTDLYFGLTIENVAKISKVMHVVSGVDDDLMQSCIVVTFLGIDNYLRSYLYMYGEWKQVSPLTIGIKSLQLIYEKRNINGYKDANIKDIPVPCVETEQWITCLPAGGEFLKIMKMRAEPVSLLF